MAEAHWTKTSPGPRTADDCHPGGRLQSAARHTHSGRFRAALMVTAALEAISLDTSANAQTMWTGANSSDWTAPGNWSGGVPGIADTAIIDTLKPSTVLNAADLAHSIFVADNGFGFLSIEDGGTLTSALGLIGSGSDGAASVPGSSALWQNSNALVVGANGNRSLTVKSGGAITSDSGSIAGDFVSHSGLRS